MEIRIKPVCTRRDLRRFIHLPSRIHRDHPNWVPPIYADEWVFFDRRKNRSFEYSDVIMLLAYRGSRLVGRIMGLVNRKYNEMHLEKNARFNFLEAYDDREVIETLIMHVEQWARAKGMERLVGPLAFSDKDPQGYLVHGFHEPMVIASHCNFEYLVGHLEAHGFDKELDLMVYKILIPGQTPGIYTKIAERALRNNEGIRLVEFTSRRELKSWVRPIFTLINETFTAIYGFIPFTLEEMDDFANRYLLIMDARYIKVVVNGQDTVVGFVIGMPDISRGIKKSRGYLFPFGFVRILLAGRRSKQLNLLLGAIRPDYQNRGIDSIMGCAMLDSARQGGLEYIDSHLEMETNTKVRAEMEYMGGKVYKTFRLFGKSLNQSTTGQQSEVLKQYTEVECK